VDQIEVDQIGVSQVDGSVVRASARPASARWRRAGLVAACALVTWCYAPALRAYFMLDDFLILALVRMVGEPLQAFYHDHFFGSPFFRPLGFLVWWLASACFDSAPRGQYAVNLLLHLGVVFALYALLQRLRRDARLNVVWAAAFGVHPVAIGTALWLSDRFDLIATAFSLLAISAAVDYARRPRPAALALLLGCVLAAFMGKEIAIVAAIAACALIALPNRDWPLTARQRWSAVAAVVLLVGAWLAYRAALLANPQNALVHADSMLAMFARGIWLWLRVGYDYFVVDPRQAAWMTLLQALGALLIVAAIVVAARAGRLAMRAWGLSAALLVLMFLPAPTQAPVVTLFVSDPGPARDWFHMAIESRLFHVSLAALIAALMLLTTPDSYQHVRPHDDVPRPVRRGDYLVAGGLLLMIVAWASASHALAHDYASHSREQIPPLRAAHEAIARLALPARHCQIYLLDTAGLLDFAGSGDAIIKATTPDLPRLQHCLILTERAPWGSFLRDGQLDDYRPLRVLADHGKPIPWLRLGDLELAYLNLDADIDARTLDDALFLEYRNGQFVDVTAAVRSGARPVRFFNARPDQK
jgi:hypothetical protein